MLEIDQNVSVKELTKQSQHYLGFFNTA